ncbi:FAD dependent oxidoreductase [Syncephalis fuscata]|nr:FAD dependent oxidoreductase [Syncephalis fuscata]
MTLDSLLPSEPSITAELPESVDVLIVGGGIAGLAAAYGIARIQPSCRVLIIEQEAKICSVTTAAAGGGFRCWWPESPELGRLARESITQLRTEINKDTADSLAFLDDGYVMLSGQVEKAQHYLKQASKASAHGGGPIWFNGRPWHLNGNSEAADTVSNDCLFLKNDKKIVNTFDLDAYRNRHDGIDVIDCPEIIQQVLAIHPQLDGSFGAEASDGAGNEDLVIDEVKALLHIRNAGYVDPIAFGQHIADRAMALGNITIATNQSKNKVVRGALLNHGITGKEYITQTPAVILAVGPYLPILGAQLDIQFAVTNEPHGRVVYNDHLAVGPYPQRTWTYWSDPINVQSRLDPETIVKLPSNVHGRPWRPPVKNNENQDINRPRQFTGVWTYDNKQQTTSIPTNDNFSNLQLKLIVPPPIPVEYPLYLLQGLARIFPKLKTYLPPNDLFINPLECVDSIASGYYCKTNNNHPIIGPVPYDNKQNSLHGLWVCGALSGHGIMLSLGCGSLLARRLLFSGVIQKENDLNKSKETGDLYDGLFNVTLGEFAYDVASVTDQM